MGCVGGEEGLRSPGASCEAQSRASVSPAGPQAITALTSGQTTLPGPWCPPGPPVLPPHAPVAPCQPWADLSSPAARWELQPLLSGGGDRTRGAVTCTASPSRAAAAPEPCGVPALAPLQTYTAVYYVLADLLMLSLYFHYKFKKRPSALSTPINSMLLFLLGVVCTTPLLSGAGAASVAAPREVFRGRTLLSVEPGNKPFTQQEIIGFVIGSISSVLYLLSRLPQIRTNFVRKSTQGISYSLFALVMLGNTLYGLSVLFKNPEEGQSEGSYLLHHLPWLVGSLGVLLLDTIISIQFLVYRNATISSERQPLLPS
ncbi:PREDICTED: lysosomal amino acid transporter 1 homolog isoform X1 [Condylura cristata]|uniref:lysosomal amino acid transporter 1 homolog isoform X1 n=1 Tax=Condylura cristata TaxID=143302 RepID=UPI0006438938|nr:PREDICTED: lysosomal amino acid transporter 1 homolog isoform X1 [Condylura cristata]